MALAATVGATVRESADQVRAALVTGLKDLGTRFSEFGWLLGEVNDQVVRIAETQVEIVCAGNRAMLEAQQQTQMKITILQQEIRRAHTDGGGPVGLPATIGVSPDERRAAELDAAGVPVGWECPTQACGFRAAEQIRSDFRPRAANRYSRHPAGGAARHTRSADRPRAVWVGEILAAQSRVAAGDPPGSGSSRPRGSAAWPLDLMTPGPHPLLELATRIAGHSRRPCREHFTPNLRPTRQGSVPRSARRCSRIRAVRLRHAGTTAPRRISRWRPPRFARLNL